MAKPEFENVLAQLQLFHDEAIQIELAWQRLRDLALDYADHETPGTLDARVWTQVAHGAGKYVAHWEDQAAAWRNAIGQIAARCVEEGDSDEQGA